MGRLLKRVPMDFDWPLKTIWVGYINPFHSVPCPYCHDDVCDYSDGLTKEAREYQRRFYGYQNDWTYIRNPYRPNEQYCPQALPYNMEKWEYDFMVSDRNPYRERLFGTNIPPYEEITDYFLKYRMLDIEFDQCMIHTLMEEYCRRNGYDMCCPHCHGDGQLWYSEEVKQMNAVWGKSEPPVGDGYQLWEDTSEGSPQSPVFATLEELSEWCAENAFTFADYRATKEEWMQMLGNGFVYHQEGNIMFI